MSTTVTFKLNKPASVFQAGESTGFGIRGGIQYYDRETKQKEWTNYEAVVFARQEGQIRFYTEMLVEGAIIEVIGKQEKIKVFDGQNGQSLSIELIDASLGAMYSGTPKPAQQPAQGGYGQQQAPQQRPAPIPQNTTPDLGGEWDRDIPF